MSELHDRAAAPLRIVIALDSFKGSVTSAQACSAVREGVLRAAPGALVTMAPIADGGEGTLGALAARGRLGAVDTIDLLGRPLRAAHLMIGDTAVIESATTVGLHLLDDVSPASARRAHSYGLGLQLARVAELERPSVVLVGLGGTGCTDGGTGALLALGARMWDVSGRELFPGQRVTDANPLLARPARVLLPWAVSLEIIGLADVDSPLLGTSGAAQMFGPQKGADDALVAELEYAMEGWAAALREAGAHVAGTPGAGAAGGLGAAVLALGGRIEPGLERIVAETGIGDALREADLVITGEGSLDVQTARGKAPEAIARLAKSGGRMPSVIALAGRIEGDDHGAIDASYCIHPGPRSLADAMNPDVTLAALAATAERVVRNFASGTST